ncbi:hypothetical protein P4V43_24685 [Brevibacillus fortis]|uniref:hypothetical protein n=1 Tax=Brevibacillus fortis TaxID=2126352 RepID=UPI002E22F976|nr:hypothetical protein [Brevibacillus fortis]
MKMNIKNGIIATSMILTFVLGYGIHEIYNVKKTTINVGSTLIDLSPEEMAAASSLIIEGKIKDITEPHWNTEDGNEPEVIGNTDTIYRDVTVKVKETHKGDELDEVIVRVYGGETETTIMDIENSPEFTNNENVLLFLNVDDSPANKTNSTDHYAVVGSYQGKFKVKNDKVENKKAKVQFNEMVDIIETHKEDENPLQ